MRVNGLSLPIGEQRRFEPLSNPAGVPNHPTYVELNLAYVNSKLDFPRSDRVRGTREQILHHPAHLIGGYTLLVTPWLLK